MRKSGAAVLFLVAALSTPSVSRAQSAVIVVRHAEKISETDQRLSEAGRARAARLAALLKDTGIVAIFSTDTERAKGTAQPLADATKLPLRIYDLPASGANKPIAAQPFIARLRTEHAHDVVLVVGHSNTVPAILQALGAPGLLKLAADEYDNLFVVVPTGRRATLVRLRY
jgi:broad specificity phosphatase PhoE